MSHYNINTSLNRLADSVRKSLLNYDLGLPVASFMDEELYTLITESKYYNPWFTPEHMKFALKTFIHEVKYLAVHTDEVKGKIKYSKIGVLLRNEAPFEGIAELLLLALSGCTLQVVSSPELNNYFTKVIKLLELDPLVNGKIQIDSGGFRHTEAIIAFAEINNTLASYLEKFPVLCIHKKGESLALRGNESDTTMAAVAELICMYFGKSSKNIRVLFIPHGFNLDNMASYFDNYSDQLFHNKYFNNFEYRKAGMLINHIPHEVLGPVIITEDVNQAGYTGVLCIQRYSETGRISDNQLLNFYPFRSYDTDDISNDKLKLSAISDNSEKIYRFILQD
jgi:hypothetical protein